MTNRELLIVKIAAIFPEWVLAAPERALINFALIIIGLSAWIPSPGTLLSSWPDWARIAWAIFISTGGILCLMGTKTKDVTYDRVGAIAVIIPALAFAVGLFLSGGRIPSGVIFLGIVVAKFIRLIRTSAVLAAWRANLRQAIDDDS